MRNAIYLLAPLLLCTLASCASQQQTTTNVTTQNTTTATTAPAGTSTSTAPAASNSAMPVAPGHGGTGAAPASGSAPGGEGQSVDTAAYDAKIKAAEAKASAKGATDADKKAAAAAYLERGNVYYSAGQPALYKLALGDFRRTLKYQPDNAEAKEKMDQIVAIYQQLGRPVPNNGLEQ